MCALAVNISATPAERKAIHEALGVAPPVVPQEKPSSDENRRLHKENLRALLPVLREHGVVEVSRRFSQSDQVFGEEVDIATGQSVE